MARGTYSQGKRQRETDKAKKNREKAERRMQKRENGRGEVPITTAEEYLGNLPSADDALRAMEKRASSPQRAASVPCRLFVGSLSWETTTDELRSAFSEYGQVSDAVVLAERDTGRSRGFGFVTMEDRKDAARAVDALDGSELHGRVIAVKVATNR
jgi:RNA recognition motif-containing protein